MQDNTTKAMTMHFSFLTLFPQLIKGYFADSILKNAIQNGLISVEAIQIREFATNAYKSVDMPQIGGGAGQVISYEVLSRAISSLQTNSLRESNISTATTKTALLDSAPHIIFLTPCAKSFTQQDAKRLAKKSHIAFVCGRYEGIDERAIEAYANEVFCVGDFILTGGELAALCLCDSIARNLKGVLGNSESLQGESFENHLLEAPVFARHIKEGKPQKPTLDTKSKCVDSTFLMKNNQNFINFCAPSVYSKGNHSRINALKNDLAVCKTQYFRPDLFTQWKLHNQKP